MVKSYNGDVSNNVTQSKMKMSVIVPIWFDEETEHYFMSNSIEWDTHTHRYIYVRELYDCSVAAEYCITRGRGERSCAKCKSATKGTVRRLGSTRKEAIASITIVSDMAL